MTKPTAGLALTKLLCGALADKKAEDLRVLDVSAQSSITDYLVIGTATSEPHLRALRIEVERVLDTNGVRILGVEAPLGSGWTVVDTFDVMVHVFLPDNRAKYRLEYLWKDATELDPDKWLAVKPLPKKRPAKKSTVRKKTPTRRKRS